MIIKMYCFEPYGLNRHRNFLECGFLKGDLTEILEYAADEIAESGCDNCGVFVQTFDDEHILLTYSYEDGGFITMQPQEEDNDFFALMDAQLRLCCYGLIIEMRPGVWRVIDE